MFRPLRAVVSGAEKLTPAVTEQFYGKFGFNILEGYGSAEAVPIISLSLLDVLLPETWHVQQGYRDGSVGMSLPGTHVMIVDPQTFAPLSIGKEGMIIASGPQIIKGYVNAPEKTKQKLIDKDGGIWFVTGDKGYIDEDGYIFIVDRTARIITIGDETISLSEVEDAVYPLLAKGAECVAVNLPDEQGGEEIVLLIANDSRSSEEIKDEILKADITISMIPAKVVVVGAIPKLNNGKIDFATSKRMAES
jgi:acyl-[acyl-carrier-protein]-phospholipid O-acyltransferase/long-chain-fatty-acid--[acyl-carrier-protein] ligase